MPDPTQSDAHVDAVLSNISVAFMQDTTEFIATKVFPIVPVAKRSDLYRTYDRDDWFREEAQERAPSTESAGSGWELGQDSYFAKLYAIHKDIDDQLRSNADSVFNLDRDATEWVTRQLLMKLESTFVNSYFGTGLWTGSTSGNDQVGVTGVPAADEFLRWDDPASDPIGLITGLIDEMQEKTSFKPNRFVLGPKVATRFKNHPDILDRIKHTQRGVATLDLIAEVIGLQAGEVMEARATRNTGAEVPGTDAGTYQFYFGNDALLTFAAPSPSLLLPSGGYSFAWTGYTGVAGVTGIGAGSRINRMRAELIRSDRIEGELTVDEKLVAPDLGIFFSNAVAA